MAAERDALSLTAVPGETFSRLLKSAGAEFLSDEALERDRAAGAPIEADGTVNLLAYSAWLVKELADGA
jgi:trimethylamine:corrinoid methyltransferase-like protein